MKWARIQEEAVWTGFLKSALENIQFEMLPRCC